MKKQEMIPPGSAPIYTHSLEYIEKYNKHLKNKKMESNTIKTKFFDKIEEGRKIFSDDWFWFIITIIKEVVSEENLSKEDTVELVGILNEELSSTI